MIHEKKKKKHRREYTKIKSVSLVTPGFNCDSFKFSPINKILIEILSQINSTKDDLVALPKIYTPNSLLILIFV